MSFGLPFPPPDSPFHVQYDDQGRIYLTWRKPLHWLAELGHFALWVVTGIVIAYMIMQMAGPVAGPAVAFVPTLFFALLKLGMVIEWIMPDRLTLGESAMRCDPYDPKETLMRKSQRWVSRNDVVAVRLVWLAPEPKSRPRRYLECDCGTEQILIARDLRDGDLEWLAAVLRAWALAGAVPVARVHQSEDVRA